MSQPTRYDKQNTYTGDLYTGADLDEDFDDIQLTTDEICDNLALIQRDDTKLANASVHPDSLDTATLALIAATANNARFIPRDEWVTLTAYNIGDMVEVGTTGSYLAVTTHVAGAVFTTDKAAGKWISLSGLTLSQIATSTTAAMVGSTGPSTVQADLDARPTSATLAASGGSALVGFLQAGTGAVSRTVQSKLRDVVSVKDFGAVGDGSTDDTVAIQAAIDSLVGGGQLYVPNTGTTLYYKITNHLVLPTGRTVQIFGDGRYASQIYQATAGKSVFKSNSVYGVTPANFCTFRGLYITAASGLYGIENYGMSYGIIEDCAFNGFNSSASSAGVHVKNSIAVNIEDNDYRNCSQGVRAADNTLTGYNGGGILGNVFESLTGIAIYVNGMSAVEVAHNVIESCQGGGASFEQNCSGIDLHSNYFEENFTSGGAGEYFDISLGSLATLDGGNVRANYFNGKGAHTEDYIPVRIKFAQGLEFGGNMLNTSTQFVKFATSAVVSRSSFGKLAHHGSSTRNNTDGTNGTYQNKPASFFNLVKYNSIDESGHATPVAHQYIVRSGQAVIDYDYWTGVVIGTGALTRDAPGIRINTGANAGSSMLASMVVAGTTAGMSQVNTNYGKEHRWSFMVSNVAAPPANGETEIVIRANDILGDLTGRGFGFKILAAALYGIYHNGTTLTTVNLGTSLSAGIATLLEVRKGSDDIYWYVNGVEVGSSTGNMPSTSTACYLSASVQNGASAAALVIGIYDVKYSVVQ